MTSTLGNFGSTGGVGTSTSLGSGAAPSGTGTTFGFGSSTTQPAAAGFGPFTSSGGISGTTNFGGNLTNTNNSNGGFGAAPSLGTLNASTNPGFGFPGSTFTTPTIAASAHSATENVPLDTKYKNLPENYKVEIDRVYKDFKAPMRETLSEIGRAKGNAYDELYEQLRKIHFNTMELETEQLKLQNEVKPFVEELKPFYHDFHLSGTTGLSQIRSRGGGTQGGRVLMLDEELPDKFYSKTAEKLERRMKECLSAVQYFEKQLAARMKVLDAFAKGRGIDMNGGAVLGGRGQYGQVTRVGAAQLILLIKQQSEAFQRISMEVMSVHQAANEIRALYLKIKGRDANPFEAADRREAAEEKYTEEKIKQEQTTKVTISSSQVFPTPTANTVSNMNTTGGLFSNSGLTAKPATQSFPSFNAPSVAPTNFGGPGSVFGVGSTNGLATTGFASATPISTSVVALDLAKPGGFNGFSAAPGFGATSSGAQNTGFGQSSFGKSSDGSSGKSGKSKKK